MSFFKCKEEFSYITISYAPCVRSVYFQQKKKNMAIPSVFGLKLTYLFFSIVFVKHRTIFSRLQLYCQYNFMIVNG